MDLRRAIVIAACLLPAAAVPAAAQSPWPQTPQQQTQSPWPQQPQQPAQAPRPQTLQQSQQPLQSPWSQPRQPAEPPCFKEFVRLRTEATKRANAIQSAGSKRKLTAQEACGLFNAFSAAEEKLTKYAVAKADECKIPPQILDSMKKAHAKTVTIRANACRAAAAPPPPRGPTLSDALAAPIPNSSNIKTGRGTFDTLTGSPLGR